MASTRTTIDGRELSVSNLDKVLFPETGFTKGQLIDYYVRIAPAILPHVRERPLTMKRFPDGVDGKFFFEKHIPSHAPEWVASVDVGSSDGEDVIPYAMINDLPTLAWAANLGTIELHVPLVACRPPPQASRPTRPHGFRPRPGRRHVDRRMLRSRGLHNGRARRSRGPRRSPRRVGRRVFSCMRRSAPKTTWDTLRDRAHEIAQKLEAEHRALVVSNMRKSLRRGRVLIDWSQNHPAKTTVAVYSVRAMAAPTVSTPVTPAEVQRCADKKDPRILRFETADVLRRIDKDGDLFAPLGLS